jgi:hypothetical protein
MPIPARVVQWTVLAMFAANVAMATGGAVANNNRITDRAIPPGFEQEAAFLEFLKYPSERTTDAFRAQDAPHWDTDTIARYIPAGGTDFVDVNSVNQGHVSRNEFLRSIQARQGLAFSVMSHLAHIYSIPYRQYSELRFSRPAESYATVSIANMYQLTFRRDPAGPVLVKCEYLEVEGD